MTLLPRAHALASLAGLLALAACAGSGQPAPGLPAATSESPTGYPAQPATTAALPTGYPAQPEATQPPAVGYPAAATLTPPPGDIDAIGRKAAEELAKKLSVDVSQIQVTQAETANWPDSSLGCPQPGLAYAQVITPGYRVVLTYKQSQYEYHADQQGRLVTCQPK